MKLTLTLIIFLLSTSLAVATPSSTITNFGYDDAGNRTTRIIDQQNFNPTDVDEKESYKDRLAGHEIKIFPNPSRGKLELIITNLKEGEITKIEVYDIRGVKVYELSKLTELNNIDISTQPSGAYFLKIFIGNKNVVWKIIKE